MAFELPPLPYAYDALEPYMSQKTLEFHHDRHHAIYVSTLNDDIVDTIYTVLVGGIDGERIRDGVDQATQPATRTFPYLCPPNSNPTDLLAVLAAGLAPVETSA